MYDQTEICLLLDLKMAIYPTEILRVVLMNKLNYFSEPVINILRFKINISRIYTAIFDMILVLDSADVNPFFVKHGVKKVMTLLLLCIV